MVLCDGRNGLCAGESKDGRHDRVKVTAALGFKGRSNGRGRCNLRKEIEKKKNIEGGRFTWPPKQNYSVLWTRCHFLPAVFHPNISAPS